MPKIVKKCIKSWKRYCPDWQIVFWNEDSFDVNSTLWTRQAYEAGKYAFVADYVRIKALVEQGGVYLDTDQELVKPLDPFIRHDAFMGFMGPNSVSAGVIGAKQGHPFMVSMLDYYADRAYFQNGSQDTVPNTDLFTERLEAQGLQFNDQHQQVADIDIYPQTYFCPTSCLSYEDCSGKDTVSLHHWAMSWRTPESRRSMQRNKRRTAKWYQKWLNIKMAPKRLFRKIMGDDRTDRLKERLRK